MMSDANEITDFSELPHKKIKLEPTEINSNDEIRIPANVSDLNENSETASSSNPQEEVKALNDIKREENSLEDYGDIKRGSIWLGTFCNKLHGSVACTYMIKSSNGKVLEQMTNIYYKKSKALSVIKHLRRAIKVCGRRSMVHIDICTDNDVVFTNFDKFKKLNPQLLEERMKTSDLFAKFNMTHKFKWVFKPANVEANKIAREEFEKRDKEELSDYSAHETNP
ncbi:unnamed protein product [Blepharisma stoltei]|uniref:RNase H type-1 domain-containing protein n=1 Tax=Blepharisma stoltei TaxID=1481888 RepID=A0AAU9ISM3_9CILI|nr:unnamed protein product [Blepharisma stoltei]